MALETRRALTWDNVNTITRSIILPGIIDSISNDMPLFKRLWGKAKSETGGSFIEKVIKFVHSTQGGYIAKSDTLNSAEETTKTRGVWDWFFFHQPIVIFGLDKATNGGPSKVMDLIMVQKEDAAIDARDKIATQLYTARTGNNPDSLIDAIDDGTNVATYGDISRTGNAFWQADLTTSAGALTLAIMAASYDAAKSGVDEPSLIMTTEALWTAYEALLQPQMRYSNTTTANGGFRSVMFRGAEVIADEFAPSGNMFYINERYMNVHYLKNADYPTDKMGFALRPFRAVETQDGDLGFIFSYHNLICTQPRRQARDTGVT